MKNVLFKLNGIIDRKGRYVIKYSAFFITFSLVLAFCMPFLLSLPGPDWFLDLGPRGTMGDTLNGLSAPFLTALAVILTYHAFIVQYNANRQQKEWNKEQRADIVNDRFEANLFHFIGLLSQQECMCKIEGVGEGKQAFHFMFYEFKAILYYVMKEHIYEGGEKEKWEFYLSYYLFINGASGSSIERLLSDISSMCENDEKCIARIYQLNKLLLEEQKVGLEGKKSIYMLADYYKRKIRYFDGHRLRLIPFYRHLCMMVQYINVETHRQFNKENEPNTIPGVGDEKEVSYLHILCSQLSEHELALLLLMFHYGDKERYCPSSTGERAIKYFFEKILPQYIDNKMNCKEGGFVDVIKNKIASEASSGVSS